MIIKTIKNQWYRSSIKNKLLFFFITIIFFVSVISFYSHYNAYRFMEHFNHNLTSYFRINKLLIQIRDHKKIIRTYLKDLQIEDFEAYQKSVDSINTTLSEVERESNSLDTYLLIRAIKNSLTSYYRECDLAIRTRKAEKEGENYYIYFYRASRISDYIENYIQQLLYVTLSEDSWFYGQLVEKARIMKTVTFISILSICLFGLGFGLVFSNYLTGPIRKLAQTSLQMSEGDLNVKKIEVKSMDEVGILAHSFNKMSSSIRQLVNDLTEKSRLEKKLHEEELKNIRMQQLLKDAQFIGLQSQINPHFLFNTLNAIARTSMFEQADRTTKLIQSLSNLFRYNLANDSKDVTLAKELKIVQEYLYIQQYRFGDRIKFDLRCHADTEKIFIPAFTLQPLVENAIIHGIEPKEEGGMLRISIFEKNKKIIIKIVDNGVGISKERLAALLSHEDYKHIGHMTGIGIENVSSRLKLYYNTDDCFRIKSKVGWGTLIIILIPMREEVKENV
ncbi:MAG: hypothetical protein PWP27_847 [Clostridiales bacterium]|nr:hypothetical protein [Clostridiales bacterium]MDK2933037.1 hypothetical protein [Clostridiales bacterium]